MSDIPPPPSSQPPPPPPGNLTPPPGYVAYGTGPSPTEKLGRVGGLSKAIIVLVGLAALLGVASAVVQLSVRPSAEDFLASRISQEDFESKLISVSLLFAGVGVATLAAMVVVMIWMYRITSNIRAYGHSTTWHPLFAVFGWFLPPGVLYVIPLLMLREQWSKSRRPANPGDQSSGDSGENPFLWAWWALFGLLPLLTAVLSGTSPLEGFGDTGTERAAQTYVDTSVGLTWLAAIGGLLAALAWIVFVRQLTARHQAMTGEN